MRDQGTVLVLLRNYLPGYQSGGPVRTLANMVERLGDEFRFRIITSDRDALDECPYSEVEIDGWNRVGKADVYYASPPSLSFRRLSKLIAATPHDVLYLNSFFHRIFGVQPLIARRLGLLRRVPVVLAPRGELSAGVLKLKGWKKVPYMTMASRLGLYRDLVWQASSDFEVEDIRRMCGSVAERVVVAPNLPGTDPEEGVAAQVRYPGDALRVLFLSRITPAKNLEYALQVLAKVRVPVKFSIYGPVRDPAYWQACQRMIDELPGTVEAKYWGAVPPTDVDEVLRMHDLFFLPTRGENYGHALAEALRAGTPVLIADTTAWRGLEEAGVGWDLPLDDGDRFARCVEQCATLGPDEYAAWRERVRRYAATRIGDERVVEANRSLFESVVAYT